MSGTRRYAVPFDELTLEDLPLVGGKNASLGEMCAALSARGVRVPEGFALTVDAFRDHLASADLAGWIGSELDGLDVRDTTELARCARAIRQRIEAAPLPDAVAAELAAGYRRLGDASGEPDPPVAVRSSATAEDLPTASFAGQQDTFLHVRGAERLALAVRSCMASLYTDRAIAYRAGHGIDHRHVLLSVGIQRMVRSDDGAAGVMFTLDTESGFRDVVVINGTWGLGELLVQGRVDPDEFWVHKTTTLAGHRPIIRRERGSKSVKLVHDAGRETLREQRVPRADRLRYVLNDDEILQLARWGMAIEEHYSARSGHPVPMDIEWARDGRSGELFILQARPETVHAQRSTTLLEIDRLRERGPLLVSGRSVGARIATGPVRLVQREHEMAEVREGDVLVAEMTDPAWNVVLRRAAAVVTDHGGRTCHAAIVARELGIPCVVGTGVATQVLADGDRVTVSCAEGEEGHVYEGTLAFDRESIDVAALPETRVPLMLNIASPERAFHHALLPSAGVGLLRVEFLITDWIGIHPMAVLHPERVPDAGDRKRIRQRAAGHDSPEAFFIDRLASGIGQIAAAFHPRPVIVRFSDFKTNEYADLLGGASFEQPEANPMIGFRGASRYCDDRYREAFALECRAVRLVRDTMGLSNVKVMVPFCRTLEEGRRTLAAMAEAGLRRGTDGLEVYVMCEIPNNVILAEEFSALFDGFSIGSNDLTQLTLGVDRDSELLAEVFDERDPGVKRMIEMVIERAHRHGRPVGLCGQAPSDDPAFAEFLADRGIDSISLDPDSLPAVARRLARATAPAGSATGRGTATGAGGAR